MTATLDSIPCDDAGQCFSHRLARAMAEGPHALLLLDALSSDTGEVSDFCCVYANAAAVRELGLGEADELLGKQLLRDWASVNDRQQLFRLSCEVLARDEALLLELPLQHQGETHHYRLQLYPAAPGVALSLRRIDHEVRSRQLAEDYTHQLEAAVLQRTQALLDTEQRAHTLLGALRVGVIACAPDGSLIECNAMARRLLDLDAAADGSLHGKGTWVLIDSQGKPLPAEQYPVASVLRTGKPLQEQVYGIAYHDGRALTWCLSDAYPRFDSEGVRQEVIIQFVDISSQIRQQLASQRSRQRAEHLLYLQTRSHELHEAALQGEIEQLAASLTDSRHAQILHGAASPLHNPEGNRLQVRVQMHGQDDSDSLRLQVWGKAQPYDDHDRQLLEELGHDYWLVLQQQRLQAAWQNDRKRMQLVIAASQMDIWEYEILDDPNNVRIQREHSGGLGLPNNYTSEDAEGFRNRLHPDDRERVLAYLQQYLNGELAHYQQEFRLRDRQGEYRHILSSGEIVERYADGRPKRMVGTHLDVTEERRTVAELRAIEGQLTATLNSVSLITLILDRQGRIEFCSEHLAQLVGRPVQELLGMDWFSHFLPAGTEDVRQMFHAAFEHAALPAVYENPILTARGGVRHIRWHNSLRRNADGELTGSISIGEDITDQQAAQQELKLAATVFDSNSEGVLITDARLRVLKANRAFSLLSGHSKPLGLRAQQLFLTASKAEYRKLRYLLAINQAWQGEVALCRPHGKPIPVWLSISGVHDDQLRISHYVAVATDISERKRQQAQIEYMAYHDPLTGLPNRLLLIDRFQVARALAERQNGKLALLFIDLDRFKLVNDTLGHPAGDMLLQLVGARLHDCVRESDTVARLGGDEFLVLLQLQHGYGASEVAQAILTSMARPLQLEGRSVHSGASIGISIFPDDGRDFTELQQRADKALYQAKQEGRNAFRFYSETMQRQVEDPLELDTRLREALRNNELRVHYQPQIALESGQLVGFEALVRWEHPAHGPISPAHFIPLAEETGFILEIGAWVLHEACRQMREWLDAGYPPLTLAVNLSAIQFSRGDLVLLVSDALARSGLPAHCLELELTESVLLNDADLCRRTLNTLSNMGVQVSIDDFGTGYSCLAYLKDLDVAKLKIDRSFVMKLNDDRNRAIVSAIISMARALGLTTLAEGVEHPAELLQLHRLGCEEIQGYFCGRPLPAELCLPWLAARLNEEPLIAPLVSIPND